MKKSLMAAAALPAAALLAGCAAAPDATDASRAPVLADRAFMWAEGINEECEVPPTLRFDKEGRVSGTSGCNLLTGGVHLEGTKIDFSQMGSTRRMCSPKIMEIENAFFANLGRTVFAVADGENVQLLDTDAKLVMTLVPEKAGACR